ncbi:MAG: SRPBCC domain-containing protein [Bacteroidota bacterium]|nr:SRPBCC domain-containing protein [Bacteroidota bacterium]
MKNKNYQTSITVDAGPGEVFAAINNVRGWWKGEIKGSTDKLNDEFTYQMGDVHFSKQKIVEMIPNKKIVWQVTESNLSFVDKKEEWTGTTIEFDIQPEGKKTKITFTHHGLVPAVECYGACSGGWNGVIEKSLYSFISTGKGVDVF